MLIADKVHDRKEIIRHQRGRHARGGEWDLNFELWLQALEVNQEDYDGLCASIDMSGRRNCTASPLRRSMDFAASSALVASTRSNALTFTLKQLAGVIQLACASLALVTGAAYAQNTSPTSLSSLGQDAPAQSGWQGGTPNNLNYDLQAGSVVGDSSSNAPVSLISTGGAGGSGSDGGTPTGSGGAGGTSGQVTLTVEEGGGVLTNSAAPAAVVLTSNGGSGGTAGKMSASSGTPGVPGSGGNSGGIQFTQSGSIISNNGWNGATPGTTAVLMTANGGAAAEPLASDGSQGGDSQYGPACFAAGLGSSRKAIAVRERRNWIA